MRAKRFQKNVNWVLDYRVKGTYLVNRDNDEAIQVVQIVLPSGQLACAVAPDALGDLSDADARSKAADVLILAGVIRQAYSSPIDVFNLPTSQIPDRYIPKQDGGQGKTKFINCLWVTQAWKLQAANVCFRRYLRWRSRQTQGQTLYSAQVVTTASLEEYAEYEAGLTRSAWQRWSQELARIQQQLTVLVKTAGTTNKTRYGMINDWFTHNWLDCDPAVACAIAWQERSQSVLSNKNCLNRAISRYMEFSSYAEGFFHQFPEVLAAFKEGERLRNTAYDLHYHTVLKPAAMQQLQSL